nr:ChbG/HpnK family deacetylase [Caldimonas sp.]
MAVGERVVAVCADDVGLVDGIAETVAALAAARRLNAASCVTTGSAWRSAAAVLRTAPAPLALGLHFNLSEGAPLTRELRTRWPEFPRLGSLLAGAALGALPLAAIAAEFRAQADAFADALGRAPEFVDGHQHVHALPGVRDAVLDAICAWPVVPAARNTAHVLGPAAALKRRVIEASGGRALERALVARGVAHNTVLLGAYDFAAPEYRSLMQRWLAAAPPEGGLLFCHPGPDTSGDAIGAARRREADYLGSAAFADDLAFARVTIGPAWAKRSSSGG